MGKFGEFCRKTLGKDFEMKIIEKSPQCEIN